MTEEQKKADKTSNAAEMSARRGSKASGGKEPKWKRQSQAFQAMLKQTRRDKELMKQGVKLQDLPPPLIEEEVDDDRVGCPHCGRFFNQKAAERHIPQCSNIKARPKRLQRGGGTGGGKRR